MEAYQATQSETRTSYKIKINNEMPPAEFCARELNLVTNLHFPVDAFGLKLI